MKTQVFLDGTSTHYEWYYPFMNEEIVNKIKKAKNKLLKEIFSLQNNSALLVAYRNGSINQEESLEQIITYFNSLVGQYDVTKVLKSENLINKIYYIDRLFKKGVICYTNNDKLMLKKFSQCYVFYCNYSDTMDSNSLTAMNMKSFDELIESEPSQKKIFVDLGERSSSKSPE